MKIPLWENIMIKLFFISAYFLSLCLLSSCDPSSSKTDYYNVVMGEEIFSVPRGYVWSYDSVDKDVLKGGNFHALYPGFEYKNVSNANVFLKPGLGGGRKLLFVIKERQKLEPENILIDKIKKNTIADSKFGLSIYKYMNREFYVGLFDNNEIYISCNADNVVLYPSCRSRINISKNTTIFLTFSKINLKDWGSLMTEVYENILRFKVD